jgi:hypothetical protein
MRAADIRARLRERPFKPFSIRLTDGTKHEVRHPEGALVTNSNVVVGIKPSEDHPSDYRDYALVTLLHVVQIDPVSTMPETSSTSAENGEFS